MKNFRWTEEKIQILKENYGKISMENLSKLLEYNNSLNGIATKASNLQLRIRLKWTNNMDEILFKFYPLGQWKEIFTNLPNVTREQVYDRTRFLNILSDSKWNDVDILLLKEVYSHYTNKYLSKNIFTNRKPNDIRTIANKIGLRKSKEKSIRWYDKKEVLSSLVMLADQLGRTPLTHELTQYGLPSSKSFIRYFGGYMNACKICGLEINHIVFGNKQKTKSKNNDLCLSMGEVVITNLLIDNKIDYIKEAKYSKISGILSFGNRRCDWYLPEYNLFVEYFGMASNKKYAIKMNTKLSMCKENKIKVVALYDKDIKKLNTILSKFI
jgi:hypothetical protein